MLLLFDEGGIVRQRREEWRPLPKAWRMFQCIFLCVLTLLLFARYVERRGCHFENIPQIAAEETVFFPCHVVFLFFLTVSLLQ